MKVIDLFIGRQNHSISCQEGEEDRLKELAELANHRLKDLYKAFPTASDNKILTIALIMLLDEIKTNHNMSDNDNVNLLIADITNNIADKIEKLVNKHELS